MDAPLSKAQHYSPQIVEVAGQPQQAIQLVFGKFAELGIARQILLWFRGENVVLPVLGYDTFGRAVWWRLPVYRTIHGMLFNPIHAAAYAFGKRKTGPG